MELLVGRVEVVGTGDPRAADLDLAERALDLAAAAVEELQDWVKQNLRSSRVPQLLVFKDELPYNEIGKLLRRVVREELSGLLGGA